MLEVAHDERSKDFRDGRRRAAREIDKWQELSPRAASLTGTPSGFTDLDEITGGFQPGNLIIIAARPSMGKSALVTNIAENVALRQDRPAPVALFSLEMSEAELAQRFIASQASIRGDDLRKGRLQGGAQVEARPRRRRALPRGAAVHRRLLRHRDPRDPGQGAAAAPAEQPAAASG